uniref:UPF0690 protein C1orf52 homolog n=1 Tax=Myxine glutinosa TaxID=7769 RepID=UPI00358FEC80
MANSVQDPLAFFSAGNFSDSDEDSKEQEERCPPRSRVQAAETPLGEPRICSLPSPAEVLDTVRKPAFLRNPFAEGIDWSERLIKAPEEPPRPFRPRPPPVPEPDSAPPQRRSPPGPNLAVTWSQTFADTGQDAPSRNIVVEPSGEGQKSDCADEGVEDTCVGIESTGQHKAFKRASNAGNRGAKRRHL